MATPQNWEISDVAYMEQFNHHLISAIVAILNRIAILPTSDTVIKILTNEHVFDRATLFCRTGLYRRRAFGSAFGVFANLQHLIGVSYPPTDRQPPRPLADALPYKDESDTPDDRDFRDLDRHDDLVVHSIIDSRLWDAAHWRGIVFGQSLDQPPLLGLMFENAEKAEAIFRGWLARFGTVDSDELIRISVLRGIDKENPQFYRAHLTHELSSSLEDNGRPIINTSRMTTMTPETSKNLENFLASYRRWGQFFLTVAPFGPSGKPEFRFDLVISKGAFHVRDAWTVGEHDIDAIAIQPDDNVVVPESESDPPINKLLERRRQDSNR